MTLIPVECLFRWWFNDVEVIVRPHFKGKQINKIRSFQLAHQMLNFSHSHSPKEDTKNFRRRELYKIFIIWPFLRWQDKSRAEMWHSRREWFGCDHRPFKAYRCSQNQKPNCSWSFSISYKLPLHFAYTCDDVGRALAIGWTEQQ